MSVNAGYNFYVIVFLELPYRDIANYVCVPRSWFILSSDIELNTDDIVSYPVEDPAVTANRVKNQEPIDVVESKLFAVTVKYATNCYDDANTYILTQINQPARTSSENRADRALEVSVIRRTSSTPETKSLTIAKNCLLVDLPIHTTKSPPPSRTITDEIPSNVIFEPPKQTNENLSSPGQANRSLDVSATRNTSSTPETRSPKIAKTSLLLESLIQTTKSPLSRTITDEVPSNVMIETPKQTNENLSSPGEDKHKEENIYIEPMTQTDTNLNGCVKNNIAWGKFNDPERYDHPFVDKKLSQYRLNQNTLSNNNVNLPLLPEMPLYNNNEHSKKPITRRLSLVKSDKVVAPSLKPLTKDMPQKLTIPSLSNQEYDKDKTLKRMVQEDILENSHKKRLGSHDNDLSSQIQKYKNLLLLEMSIDTRNGSTNNNSSSESTSRIVAEKLFNDSTDARNNIPIKSTLKNIEEKSCNSSSINTFSLKKRWIESVKRYESEEDQKNRQVQKRRIELNSNMKHGCKIAEKNKSLSLLKSQKHKQEKLTQQTPNHYNNDISTSSSVVSDNVSHLLVQTLTGNKKEFLKNNHCKSLPNKQKSASKDITQESFIDPNISNCDETTSAIKLNAEKSGNDSNYSNYNASTSKDTTGKLSNNAGNSKSNLPNASSLKDEAEKSFKNSNSSNFNSTATPLTQITRKLIKDSRNLTKIKSTASTSNDGVEKLFFDSDSPNTNSIASILKDVSEKSLNGSNSKSIATVSNDVGGGLQNNSKEKDGDKAPKQLYRSERSNDDKNSSPLQSMSMAPEKPEATKLSQSPISKESNKQITESFNEKADNHFCEMYSDLLSLSMFYMNVSELMELVKEYRNILNSLRKEEM